MLNYKKYKRFETINFKDRTWPNNSIELRHQFGVVLI